MATVLDAARAAVTDDPATMRFMQFYAAATPETHIPTRGDVVPAVGVNNTADAWVPLQSTQFAA